MSARKCLTGLLALVLSLTAVPRASALANRVFVSARSGNDANNCASILTPCQTFAGAVVQLNPGGEAIVLDSGGYGPVTITQALTIEAPAGVTAFVHPPSGAAIIVMAAVSDVVTLRGLVLNGDGSLVNGITVRSVGTLNVENCFITAFGGNGISMISAGRLNVKGTNITNCYSGVGIFSTTGAIQASVDHCHLDANVYGFLTATESPGSSTTTASHATANNNFQEGWRRGFSSSGQDVLNLEFCTGSENGGDGLGTDSASALSAVRYSNCVFANNGLCGVLSNGSGTVETRGNNTITGNVSGATCGTIGSFAPM